jgi:predicted phage terminase large subunit-like protein
MPLDQTNAELDPIKAQPGPQRRFEACTADIAIYGGAAFGGKTYALVKEPLRHISTVKGFGAVIFRRTNKIIRQEGGLWQDTENLYLERAGMPRESVLKWDFPPYGNTISLAGMELERNKYDWKSTQIPLICFDQLEEFSEGQFFYLMSRNRSGCGVRPYIRATCNPDPDSFVANLCEWWIDQKTGYAIPERSGVERYFTRRGDDLVWGASRAEVVTQVPDITDPKHEIKSLTFISASFEDNKIGMRRDPGYVGSLRALPSVERERLLRGNWKIRAAAGMYFQREWFEVVDTLPARRRAVRGWDLAATTVKEGKDPDFTATVKMSVDADGVYYIEHAEHFRESPSKVDRAIYNLSRQDGKTTKVRLPQDPGQAGKAQARRLVRMLAPFPCRTKPVTGDKVTRAAGLSSQVEAGNVRILRGNWNDTFFAELENFPDGAHDDIVDAAADAFDELHNGPKPIGSGWVTGAY